MKPTTQKEIDAYGRIPIVNTTTSPYTRHRDYITPMEKKVYDYFRNYVYLNGHPPRITDAGKFFGIDHNKVRRHYCGLSMTGLLIYDPYNDSAPRLGDGTAGMCRVPFKGEITAKEIQPTKESLINFYDLINTGDFSAYRVMVDLKYPYYRIGDYLILCPHLDYEEGSKILCFIDNVPKIGRWTGRIHDGVFTDFMTGEAHPVTVLTVIGEIIGSIRMETPMEKLFLKGRVKIQSNEFKDSDFDLDGTRFVDPF